MGPSPIADVRADFPYLERRVNNKPIVYLDSAATTQKPRQVIDRVSTLYSDGVANVHRAVNFLADEVTELYEESRRVIARFINADPREIVFVSNATQGVNFVCKSLTRSKSITVISTTLEHHSNLLPWIHEATVEFVPWDRCREPGSLDSELMLIKPPPVPQEGAYVVRSGFASRVAGSSIHGCSVP